MHSAYVTMKILKQFSKVMYYWIHLWSNVRYGYGGFNGNVADHLILLPSFSAEFLYAMKYSVNGGFLSQDKTCA